MLPSCGVLVVPSFASLSALSFPGISQYPGVNWMNVCTFRLYRGQLVVYGVASVRWLGLLTASL